MHYRSRMAAAVVFLAAGAGLAVTGFFSSALALDFAAAMAVGFLGLVIVALGVLLLRRALAARVTAPPKPSGAPVPLPYYTRNCPFCGRRLGLKADKCPDCRRRPPDDSTGSAGAPDAGAADAFAAAREAAVARGSTGYIWRAVRDDATCERCANNDGHTFSWEREPSGGHAGARPRCRCRPEPVFPAPKARGQAPTTSAAPTGS